MEKLKAYLGIIKRHLDISILIVPNNGTKLRRFPFGQAITIVWVYSFLLILLGYLFGMAVHKYDEVQMTNSDVARINTLNEKVVELTNELQSIKDSNRKLKNAILLADSTAFGNIKKVKTKEVKSRLPGEGNIFGVYISFVNYFKEILQESYYFIKPAEGFISRGFNSRNGHFGMDIVLKTGNAVYSSGNGYVVFADYTPEDGYMLIISHSNDFVTIYKHCSVLLKKQRDSVVQGEIIALSGNTGKSSGPHLHFEIWKKGVPQNPEDYLITN